MRPSLQILILVGWFLLVAACTRGKVIDASTNDPVGGASVRVSPFPYEGPSAGSPPPEEPTTPWQSWWSFSYNTTSNSQTYDGFNYGYDRTAASCVSGVADYSLGAGWYRVRVTKSGFDRHISYQYRERVGEPCQTYDCNTGEYVGTTCVNFEDAAMIPSSGLVALLSRYEPDLVPDVRELATPEIECAWQGMEVGDPDVVAIRFATGVANAGAGELRIEAGVEGASCSADHYCSAGFNCLNGSCTPDSCSSSQDCPGHLTCSGGLCSNPACNTDSDCGGVECIFPGTCALKGVLGAGSSCDPNSTGDVCPTGLTCDAGLEQLGVRRDMRGTRRVLYVRQRHALSRLVQPADHRWRVRAKSLPSVYGAQRRTPANRIGRRV